MQKIKNILPSPFTIFPKDLLAKIEKDFWNFNETQFCFPELSHRSTHYAQVNKKSQQFIKEYFHVPDSYEVLYLPPSCAHPSIPFNLNKLTKGQAIYVVNDNESQHAYQQAVKINPQTGKISNLKDRAAQMEKRKIQQPFSFYTFYSKISLEQGTITAPPVPLPGQILVCSLNGCSHYQEIDVYQHGVIIFQTGRGTSLSGMSVIIIKKDLIGHQLDTCPDMMDFQQAFSKQSIVNTPFTLVPLMTFKQLEHLLSLGYTLSKVKNSLLIIKQQYQNELSKHTEVAKTEAEGIVKFKLPSSFSKEQAQQYGYVEKEWITLVLQLYNKGSQQSLAKKIFE